MGRHSTSRSFDLPRVTGNLARSLAAAALLAVFAAAGCGGGEGAPAGPYAGLIPSGPRLGEIAGVSSHMSASPGPVPSRDFEIARLADAGLGHIRTDFTWSAIEPSDDDIRLEGYDALVDACGAAGIRVRAVLDYGVGWASPDGTSDGISTPAWADYVSRVAAHFAGRVGVWEVWNEENLRSYWTPAPNPRRYGELLEAAYGKVHAADPAATVLFGGLSTFSTDMFAPNGPWTFLKRVAEAHPDVCSSIDALAIHPYSFLQQTMPEARIDVLGATYLDLESLIDAAHGMLAEIGCPEKPLHLTEVGWPDLLIGQDRQAAYLARSLVLAASKGVAAYDWYTFWDGSGDAALPTEDAFGLFAWPQEAGRAKPSWHSLVAALDLLGGSRFAGDLGAALGWAADERALVFADEAGGSTIALWLARSDLDAPATAEVPLPPHTGRWELVDLFGRKLDGGEATGGGPVAVELSGRPVYLAAHHP